MGKDFVRLVELAVASGALIVPSASLAEGPPRGPASPSGLVVESARLDRDGLTIQFSGPLKAPAGVDPSRFRLTFAYYSAMRPGYYSYYRSYYGAHRSVTRYEDVGRKVLGRHVEQLAANTIRIPAAAGLSLSAICRDIGDAPASREKAGLYLHYSRGEGADVRGTDGTALASIAPYWAAKGAPAERSGVFEGRPIPVAVRCR